MSDFQDKENQFEEFEESPGSQPQKAKGNRSFMIAIGVIGAIFVIALIILGATLLSRSTQQASRNGSEAERISTANFSTAAAATADELKVIAIQETLQAAAKAAALTPVSSATLAPTAGAAGATSTPVVAVATASNTPTATLSAEKASTATSSAATQLAQGTKTLGVGGNRTAYPAGSSGTLAPGTPQPTPTALPQTGFADEVGLPGLMGLAVLLVLVVILARRARFSTR